MKSQIVKIKRITKLINHHEDRYNLEVADNHNYFANNVLVHNCCCLAIKKGKVYLFSRQGKPFGVLDHVAKELEKIMPDGDVWHGELYVHGEEFQKIVSAIKRDKPTKDSATIQYHVYDCVQQKDYEQRFAHLFSFLIKDNKPVSDIVKMTWTKEIKSASDLSKIHAEQIARGYEGIMLRNKEGFYEIDKRSKNLQKVKVFSEEEFEIVGAEENLKKPGTCSFICKTDKGATFKCMPEGDEYTRQQYWLDWYGGKTVPGAMLTIQFFSWTTSANPVPRFPVGKTLRNYE